MSKIRQKIDNMSMVALRQWIYWSIMIPMIIIDGLFLKSSILQFVIIVVLAIVVTFPLSRTLKNN